MLACCCVGRACLLLPRLPTARFIDFGRLYPGGGKQWSAPTPTMLWRRPVGPVGRLGRPRSVSSISDVYTQEVGNNGRHQLPPCCGAAPSVRPAATVAQGPFHRFRTFIPRRWETMVGTNPYHVVAVPRRSGRPPRSPAVRFIDFGRLYPGGGKQWSGPTPTLLWRCDVRSVGARSDRARCCLFRCALLRRSCVRAAASAVRAAASAVRACSSVCPSCLLLCRSCVMLRRAFSLLCRACMLLRRRSARAAVSCVRAAGSVGPAAASCLRAAGSVVPAAASCVRAAVPCVRAAASAERLCCCVVRACCSVSSACVPQRRPSVLLPQPFVLQGRLSVRARCCVCRACVQQRRLSVRARCCVCRAFVLLRRPCDAACRCVFRACVLPAASALHASVLLRRPCMLAAASVAHGPFHRFRTFIPRRWETMVGTNPYTVVELRRRSRRCTVCPCCPLPVPCAVCACGLLCSVCTLLRHQCVRACCCAVRACCCVCSARVLLCRSRVLLRLQCVLAAAWVRGCCCCVGRARSVRACVLLSRSTPGPFCRIRTFIPRGLETMVGLNPYHVVALRRRFGRPLRSPKARFIDFGRLYPGGGKQWSAPTPTLLWRCDVGPVGARSVRAVCCLSREQSARACCCVVCACCCDTSACVRATASAVRARCGVVRACCCDGSACVLLRLQCVGAAAASAVRGLSVRACCCLGRPPARFVESGRLYPGGWKQWSASTPTMSWHCAVGSAGRYGRPRPVSSISDVYTQEVGNNGRHQPLHCCGVATSVRSVHGLSVLSAACPVSSLRERAAV
ncbi:hypothetical protein MRB53_036695 [Persea americana]|nr:hypothetical protein MRB53_036695 [Persea americana]